MITNISSVLTPALMWSGITVIPAIEPATRIIMNVGLLISNRYQYHCKKRNFNPDFSFTTHSSYIHPKYNLTMLKCDFAIQQLDLARNVSDVKKGNSKELKFRLKNSDRVHTVNQEEFKLYSGTYRKLSADFLAREGVCYLSELKEFKDISIPDSFFEKNFDKWTGYLTSATHDKDDLNQIEEFVFPECFSEESLNILNDYFSRMEYALKDLDQKSLLDFFKVVDYLEMPAMEGDCVIPFLENILKTGQSELSEAELKEIENSAILGAYIENIKSLCAEIKKCKDKYNNVDFPKELADLDLEMNKIRKEIGRNVFSLVVFGILPLYPLFLQTVSPLSWLILQQSLLIPGSMAHKAGLRYSLDMIKMAAMIMYGMVPFILLPLIGNEMISTTHSIFRKTVNAIDIIALNILYAPVFVLKETGKAILFTAKTLGKIPSIVHSRLFSPNFIKI